MDRGFIGFSGAAARGSILDHITQIAKPLGMKLRGCRVGRMWDCRD
ncbi:hypothetical protein LC55x_0697 [Lysobacter capsici]|nr:hypothetical protein LC55x_0697 [Lysobacter capsici]